MTVKELIERLQKLNQDLPVCHYTEDCLWWSKKITSVEEKEGNTEENADQEPMGRIVLIS